MIVNGFNLPASDSYFEKHLDERGFQIDRLDRALSYVDKFGLGLDCGAHIGTWSIEMCKRFKEVLAFEPHPDTCACLFQNIIEHNVGNITVHRMAVGNEDKLIYIGDDNERPGNTGARYIQEGPSNARMITIDSLELEELDFLKLDLEGYEYFAILGGLQTIEKFKPVILVEEKSFNKRYNVEDKMATKVLLDIGANIVERIGKDYIFSFK